MIHETGRTALGERKRLVFERSLQVLEGLEDKRRFGRFHHPTPVLFMRLKRN
jgi:hypothetical protein